MPKPDDLRLKVLAPEVLETMTYEELEVHAREIYQLRQDLTAYTRLVVGAMDEHLTASNLIQKLARNHSERELAVLDLPDDVLEKVRRAKSRHGDRPITVVGL
jgi:hypothetical protein